MTLNLETPTGSGPVDFCSGGRNRLYSGAADGFGKGIYKGLDLITASDIADLPAQTWPEVTS